MLDPHEERREAEARAALAAATILTMFVLLGFVMGFCAAWGLK